MRLAKRGNSSIERQPAYYCMSLTLNNIALSRRLAYSRPPWRVHCRPFSPPEAGATPAPLSFAIRFLLHSAGTRTRQLSRSARSVQRHSGKQRSRIDPINYPLFRNIPWPVFRNISKPNNRSGSDIHIHHTRCNKGSYRRRSR